MKSVAEIPRDISQNLIGVLTDIDDTITTDGRLPAAAYSMLERLSDAGLLVIPITGRPAGWCDMVARFWPVAGVVGENGALAFRYNHETRQMKRTFMMDDAARNENRKKLNELADAIVDDVKGAAVASDQLYREADLAIDFCEDVPALSDDDVERILKHFHDVGAVAKASSIHVNGWFGDWDKLSMTRKFLMEEFFIDLEKDKDRFIYCGDSPNDSPMFGFFPNACGVANVQEFVGRMEALPAFVANARGGDGFVEIGEQIIAARTANQNTNFFEGT
ncbi:MAG: HAD family hydrolase [Blastopirellula sp.]|nr:MAG: HAD family hydrolase [Blastopirellula sp.]